MNRLRFTYLLLACCLAVGAPATAEHFSYGLVEPAGLHNETFSGKRCYVLVHGPSGGSYVKGVYDNRDGELLIAVDRFSHLTIRGRARKVIVMYVNSHCSVDLSQLDIGDGGVEIHSVTNASGVAFGRCSGLARVLSVDEHSSITLREGTKLVGQRRFYGGSLLRIEKLSLENSIIEPIPEDAFDPAQLGANRATSRSGPSSTIRGSRHQKAGPGEKLPKP